MALSPVYDRIGNTYSSTRRADPRIGALVSAAVPPLATVLNVGAGTGSYEPEGRTVVAVEPSEIMIGQRSSAAAPAVRAVAEALPFASRSFDVVLGVLTLHHWTDWARGLDECRRVARRRMVFLTWDPDAVSFWLVDEYFPQILEEARTLFVPIGTLQQRLGNSKTIVVPVPGDCMDGFLAAYWKRPEAYLNSSVRRGISAFASVDDCNPAFNRLESDLASGEWDRRHAHLRELDALDLGYRLVVAEVT